MADPVTTIGGLAPPRPAQHPIVARPVTGGLRLAPPGTARQVKLKAVLADPNLPDWARAAVENPNQRRSIGAQIGGVFGGLIPGAIHLAKDAATDVRNLIPGALQTIRHHGLTGTAAPELGRRELALRSTGVDPGPSVNTAKMFPLATQTGKSFEQTAGRLAQLGPVEVRSVGGEKIDTYGDKYRQGDIVNALLQDVGNVAMAGGAVGIGLRGLGLERAADVASTVGRLGGRAANAPIEAVGGVLKGGRSVWRDIGQAGKEAVFERLPKEGALGSRIAMAATPEGRVSRAAAKAAMTEPSAAVSKMMENLAKDAGLVGKKVDKPSLIEQEVGLSRVSGVAQADKLLADQLGPEAALTAHVPFVEPGQRLTPEGQALAHEYAAGTLAPDVMARIDKVTDAYRKQASLVTEGALSGEGRIKGPMDPAYLGDAPLNEQVTRRLVDSGTSEADAGALQQMVDQGAKWEDLAPLAPELGQILLDPQVYPKQWREAMHVTRMGTEAGAIGLPRTPEALLAAGIDRPAWMPTMESRIGRPRGPATVPTTTGFSSGLRGVASEHHSQAYGTGPYSLANAAEGLAKNISSTKFNNVIQKYVEHADVPTAGKIIDQTTFDALRQEAERYVDAANLGGMNPAERSRMIADRYGRSVIDELRQQGYEVLPGNKANAQPGDFDPSKPPNPREIGPDSVVLPAGVKDHMVQHRTGKLTNVAIAANQKINQFFKRNVLAFNLHWTPGDAISNMLMSWVAGGIDPMSLARSMRDVKGLAPEISDQIFNRPEFTATGLRHQAVTALDPLALERAPARTTVGRGVRRAQDVGFKANQVVNSIQRRGYILEKLERELRSKGLDSTSALGTDVAKWKEPAVQKSINDVINDANKTFGTLDEMSPFEQRVMTQIFPFWSWTRHITSLAARTAVDNPARILWTLRLGAIGMNTSPQDMPDFMRGSIPGPGGGRINLNWANPLYDVGSGGLASPGAALRSTSPLIKVGATAAFNRDLGRDANVTTHRPGTAPSRLASAFYQAVNATPFTRGAINLAPTSTVPGLGLGLGPVRRYGSGQAIVDKATGQVAPNGSRLRALANTVNLPMETQYVPTQAVGQAVSRARRSGLKRQGLSSGRLHRTGLSNG